MKYLEKTILCDTNTVIYIKISANLKKKKKKKKKNKWDYQPKKTSCTVLVKFSNCGVRKPW